MTGLTLQNAVKRFGEVQVIHGVDLNIEHGEFCVFVGPSGCGKSTLLRMIAGLEDTTEGSISIGQRDVTEVDASERGVAMVFQTYALYPHMTVAENMGFGLRMNKVPKAEIDARVAEAARILQLDALLDRKPKALSGGQRQRVAIGRAIVRNPDVFLFDEPLSNLDAELRVAMRVEIAKLHSELDATMIYVTHDQVEAMTMADKIVVLRDGRVEQVGAPLDLYDDPDNIFVAGFIGSPAMNFLKGRVADSDGGGCKVLLTDYDDAELTLSLANRPQVGAPITIGVRPEHFDAAGETALTLKAEVVEHLGGRSFLYAKPPHAQDGDGDPDHLGQVVIETREGRDAAPGQDITVHIGTEVMAFDADGARLR